MFLKDVEKITGLSGYRIAKLIGVQESQYYRWKRDKAWPSREYLSGLASLPFMSWETLGELIDLDVYADYGQNWLEHVQGE